MAGEMAFLYGTPAGVAGSVSRPLDSEVEPIKLSATNTPTAFGVPLTLDSLGQARAVTSAASQASLKGLLVRSVPSFSGSTSDTTFTSNTPNAAYTQGRLIHGYAKVVCTVGTPVKGGTVYVRVVAATGKAIGDIEATADGSDNIAMLNAEFAVNGKDGNNVTEIRIKVA